MLNHPTASLYPDVPHGEDEQPEQPEQEQEQEQDKHAMPAIDGQPHAVVRHLVKR